MSALARKRFIADRLIGPTPRQSSAIRSGARRAGGSGPSNANHAPACHLAFEARSDYSVLSSHFISAIRPTYAKSVRATSIRTIAIMTNAVETNRILGSPLGWCMTPAPGSRPEPAAVSSRRPNSICETRAIPPLLAQRHFLRTRLKNIVRLIDDNGENSFVTIVPDSSGNGTQTLRNLRSTSKRKKISKQKSSAWKAAAPWWPCFSETSQCSFI